ncbi:MAG: fructose-bisphosphate aldolase [Gammaproteobacteria bacterium (ex Lamellibrachia satsuma)]|nr:MAG: ketose-bisphosphate aldolase [Gammaproteobacteria bacterium (ex Lamellibrachia satsuma)]RRS31010.1 MAG: fructose-bisphosphate aldolase [Gammaproteobacteria bacterium (ex Lamellibrachia satsuma)]RRS36023.1 MAG: fructose-bisphosphate aldolase [Gammaproteobacteria bacterium (ex Lamellibrachia satsuma)]
MPLVAMKEMLQHAYDNGYAIGAFDLISLEFLEGIMQAAERCHSPVILSLAESHFEYFDFDQIMPAVETAARRSTVPVAIHLDHGDSLESAVRAINAGCNGVMVDTSHQSLSDNINSTRAIVDMARDCGIPVEGELGYVPGVEGEDAQRHPGEIAYTTVDEAMQYVEETGVDFLAVSIGTVHGRMQGEPKLDIARLAGINEVLQLPLVIHGGTGLSPEQFQSLIAHGVAKINYFTALADAAAGCIHENARALPQGGYSDLVKGVNHAISAEVEHCLRLWGSVGRSEEVLAYCVPWEPVEHLIIYNVAGIDEKQAHGMIAEGREVLCKIPGVLDVVTGQAIKEDAQFRYTWLVRFCHASVIDSYREHPLHVAFADRKFRPVAGERISIDYQLFSHG